MPDVKVCLVSPVPPPYGGISHGTRLMRRYASRNSTVQFHQVDTAVRWRPVYDQAVAKRVIGGGVQLLRNYVVYLRMLLKDPDVVHLKTSGELGTIRDLLLCLTARLFRVPVAYHLHFGRIPQIAAAKTLEWEMLALIMRFTDAVMAVDKPTAEAIRSRLPVRVEYTPNAIDVSELPGIEELGEAMQTVIFLGWVIPTKGVEELVQAWSELALRDWDLLLVGPVDDVYREDLLARYQPQRLKFLGELKHDDAMRLIARCGIFVLPSYTEGFPNVILEAMAYAKPIIATAVGAISDMLAHSCGILVEPKNVLELKRAILRLSRDEQLRREYGERARERVRQKYALDVAFARYAGIWLSLGEKRRDCQSSKSLKADACFRWMDGSHNGERF